jgi:hypothetical protein
MTRCACLVFALVLAAGSALANIPFPDLCVLENADGSDGAVVFVLPNGGGNAFNDARLDGATVDATLTLTVVNNVGDPLANVAVEDMWVVSTGGGVVPCTMIYPDDVTDANGQAQWVQSPFAGGNSLTEDTQAFIAGDPVPGPVPVHFVSGDINGDLTVNLSDITVFTQALSTYSAEADYNADGVVNLSDITLMAQGIGAECP